MTYRTLVATEDVARHLDDPEWAICDARFLLTDTGKGRRDYLAGHVPGAVYADLDHDLSGSKGAGKMGRHPLPEVDALVATLSRWGIGDGVQVVVYDDASGMYAGRLWWMLRWLGHDAVAVMDGDWRQWVKEGRPVRAGEEMRSPRVFTPRMRPHMVATAEEIAARLGSPDLHLFDARAADRFRGENETLDPVAGHIPGACSAPYAGNLDAEGRMLTPEQLRARYAALLGDAPVEEAIFYCGSGVSAAHDLLALEHAGLGSARIYAGSWSDWITDAARPVAREEKSKA